MRAWPILLMVLLFVPWSISGEAPTDPAVKEWNEWKEARDKRLRQPVSWLTLVALDWLNPGENRFDGVPGLFLLDGTKVTLKASAADGYTLKGQPITERLLNTDTADEPDRLMFGKEGALMVIERSGRFALRVWNGESAVRKNFKGIEYYDYDPRWRVSAKWEQYPEPKTVQIQTVIGTVEEGKAPGRAHFVFEGKEYSLEPTQEDDQLFFVFKDATSGKETYPACRFIYTPLAQDGKLTIDFNRAYNPPCSFTPYATCPLPTKGNILPIRVAVGEKKYEVAAGR